MKETKELAVGAMVLTTLMVKHLKDGVQVGKDFPAIWAEISASEDIKMKLEAAYKDVSLIKGEWEAPTVAGVADLVAGLIPEIVKMVESFKPAPAPVVEPAPAPVA